jgi:hypothetical protein
MSHLFYNDLLNLPDGNISFGNSKYNLFINVRSM